MSEVTYYILHAIINIKIRTEFTLPRLLLHSITQHELQKNCICDLYFHKHSPVSIV